MPKEAWFWVIYIVFLLFGGFLSVNYGADRRYIGGGVVLFILVGLLGYSVFGSPIK